MKLQNWLFNLFPWLFPKKKKAVKIELERVLQERWKVVTKRLHVEGLLLPPILRLWGPHGTFYLLGKMYLSCSIIFKSTEEKIKILDHEITHHIQHAKNQYIGKIYSLEFLSFFYWCLTGTLKFGLAQRAYQEGFATYVAYLTSYKLPKRVEDGITIVQKRKRLKMLLKDPDALPYVLGYLGYSAIAETKSDEEAIKLGLSAKPSQWVSESRIAISKAFAQKYEKEKQKKSVIT